MPAPLRLVVFDIDGTLIDSLASIRAAMEAAAGAAGVDRPDPDRVRRSIGLRLDAAIAEIFGEATRDRWAALAEYYKESHRALRAGGERHDPLFPGALEAIEAIEASGCLLGVATGKGRRGLDLVLEMHGLEGRFVTLQTADTGPGKPHPDMLERAMGEAGVEPGDTLMIGDTSFDMAMARAAGAHALGVGWGYHPVADLWRAGAHEVAGAMPEVPDFVARLLPAVRTPA